MIDLDGDGIETVSQSQSGVHFDLNGDYFAESTGWVSADDGFAVRDVNGNGRIDDISEMFGGPDRSGFGDLAALDGNHDGVITLADAQFASLRIWRDLDGDGITDAGELSTLAESNIASLSTGKTAQNFDTPQGTHIFAKGNDGTGFPEAGNDNQSPLEFAA